MIEAREALARCERIAGALNNSKHFHALGENLRECYGVKYQRKLFDRKKALKGMAMLIKVGIHYLKTRDETDSLTRRACELVTPTEREFVASFVLQNWMTAIDKNAKEITAGVRTTWGRKKI